MAIRPHLTAVSVAILLGAGFAPAQEPLRVDVNLRTVQVVVQSPDGQFLDAVPVEDFLLTDDGRAQTIRHFDPPRDRPLSIGLVVDASGSMTELIGPVTHALQMLVESLRELDDALLLTYNARTRLQAELTHDPLILGTGLATLGEEMSTDDAVLEKLYDGVSASLKHLSPATGRRVVIVLTNGMDTFSRTSPEELGRELLESNALLYAISFDRSSVARERLAPMARLAQATGGRAVLVSTNPSEAEPVLRSMIDELHHQYEMGYYPEGGRGGPVKVWLPDPSLRVRVVHP